MAGVTAARRPPPGPAGLPGADPDAYLDDRGAVVAERRKKPTVAAVAVARELAGWCWSLATIDD